MAEWSMLTVMVLLCCELLKTCISSFSIMKERHLGHFLRYVSGVDLACMISGLSSQLYRKG